MKNCYEDLEIVTNVYNGKESKVLAYLPHKFCGAKHRTLPCYFKIKKPIGENLIISPIWLFKSL
ncbi:hypothetical protein J6P92_09430 [bacterium]|nr:hypothetical protein [bacterium]